MLFPYKIRWQFVGSIDRLILFVTASSVVINQMLELICICSHYTGRSLPHIFIYIHRKHQSIYFYIYIHLDLRADTFDF